MVKTPISTVKADQQYITVLVGKIADLIGHLDERGLEIANLTTALRNLDNSRHASTCQYHNLPRKRFPNSGDEDFLDWSVDEAISEIRDEAREEGLFDSECSFLRQKEGP